ncbi:MAG: MarC family protein [Gammaproteobacteria bacterium]
MWWKDKACVRRYAVATRWRLCCAAVAGFALAPLLAWSAPVVSPDGSAVLSLGLGKIFTFFFLTLGPNRVVGPFARATASCDGASRRRIAVLATGVSLLSVVLAATIGVTVLENWGISSGALLVAAGIMLFLVAVDSIKSQYRREVPPPAEDDAKPVPAMEQAFRMAFPYIVSPYGVAVVILVLTTRPESVPQAPIFAMLVGIMLLNLAAMLAARNIAGSSFVAPALAVLGSVLAVLQAALGVQAVMLGLRLAGMF